MVINGFPNYLIEPDGSIYSKGFKLKDKRGRAWTKLPRKLKLIKGSLGYLNVKLIDNDGVKRTRLVHRLIAEHFIPNPKGLPFVNHLDGNPSNNDIKNLEWCTQNRNMYHSYYILNKKYLENRPIIQIRPEGGIEKVWPSVNMAAKALGLTSNAAIWNALNRSKSHKSHGFIWKYQ